MSIKKLIEKATENWIAKIVCLALAVLIYLFHIASMLDKKSLIVPLNVVADGILVPVNEIPQNIRVNVRAKSETIATITASGISASISLTHFTEEGVYDVPVNIRLSNELMLIEPLEVFVRPDRISVSLDKKAQKYLPVEPSISGEPEHGYTIHSVSVVPSSVKVVGPASIVEKTDSIYTEKVNVKGASKGLSSVVGLDSAVKVLQAFPEEGFRVSVEIGEEKTSVVFREITPKLLNLKEEFLLDSIVPPVSFTLEGAVSRLEKYKPSDSTVFLNCASIASEGEYTIVPEFDVPNGISVMDYSPKNVLVKVVMNNILLQNDDMQENSSQEGDLQKRSLQEGGFQESGLQDGQKDGTLENADEISAGKNIEGDAKDSGHNAGDRDENADSPGDGEEEEDAL